MVFLELYAKYIFQENTAGKYYSIGLLYSFLPSHDDGAHAKWRCKPFLLMLNCPKVDAESKANQARLR